MSVMLYDGVLSDGSSPRPDDRILLHMSKGLPVIANYDLDKSRIPHPELFTYMDNEVLSPQALVDFAREWSVHHEFVRDGILVVVHDCQNVLGCSVLENTGRMSWMVLLSEHEELGLCLVFIAPHYKMVDLFVRSFCGR